MTEGPLHEEVREIRGNASREIAEISPIFL
jgi:hypothetical protein